jgi:putative copper export protein
VTLRTRKAVAVVCIAVVLVAGMLPAVSTALGSVVLVALYVVVPAVAVTVIRRTVSDYREPPVSLLALIDSRGPPSGFALA